MAVFARGRSWLLGFAMCALFAVAFFRFARSHARSTLPPPDGAMSGDIIFLQGRTIRGTFVRLFEGSGGDYSHVGIIVIERGRPFIIHANPGDDSRNDRVVKEPWYAIVAPHRITDAAIFRLAHAPAARMVGIVVAGVTQQFEREALPFDHEFDLMTPQKLYCTELVWRAYVAAGVDLRGDSFGSDRKYLLPSDLLRSGLLRQVPISPDRPMVVGAQDAYAPRRYREVSMSWAALPRNGDYKFEVCNRTAAAAVFGYIRTNSTPSRPSN